MGWNVSTSGEIKVFAYNSSILTKNLGRCYFRVTSYYSSRRVADARQTIILANFSLLISAGLARYHASADFQCFGSQYVIIELRFTDINNLTYLGIFSGEKYLFLIFVLFYFFFNF
jgi:hypothetical protein